MNTRVFARIMGVVFLLVGIAGFIPGLTTTHADPGAHPLHTGHAYLLGLFPVNLYHNIVHILFGVLGLVMSGNLPSARTYARILAVAYGLLAIMGLIPPPVNTTFGLIPIWGHDVWLHAAIAAAGAYFGFLRPAAEDRADTAYTDAAPRV